MYNMFSKNNILLIIFLCVVIFSISYYKTLTVENNNIIEKYSNLYYANSPIKFKGCSS
jgi:hypothetical protein